MGAECWVLKVLMAFPVALAAWSQQFQAQQRGKET
jgi:hypothetical protein